MKLGLELIFWIFRLTFTNRNKLLLENLALRQQLVVQQRSVARIKQQNQDCFFWSLLSQLWTDWKFNLFIVKPETVVKWHWQGFKLYWRWKSNCQLASVDFFTVPTVTFQILYCFIVLRHDQRSIVHFNITTNPTSQWTAQRIIETFPYDQCPIYLIRDRDAIYGHIFQNKVKNMDINI